MSTNSNPPPRLKTNKNVEAVYDATDGCFYVIESGGSGSGACFEGTFNGIDTINLYSEEEQILEPGNSFKICMMNDIPKVEESGLQSGAAVKYTHNGQETLPTRVIDLNSKYGYNWCQGTYNMSSFQRVLICTAGDPYQEFQDNLVLPEQMECSRLSNGFDAIKLTITDAYNDNANNSGTMIIKSIKAYLPDSSTINTNNPHTGSRTLIGQLTNINATLSKNGSYTTDWIQFDRNISRTQIVQFDIEFSNPLVRYGLPYINYNGYNNHPNQGSMYDNVYLYLNNGSWALRHNCGSIHTMIRKFEWRYSQYAVNNLVNVGSDPKSDIRLQVYNGDEFEITLPNNTYVSKVGLKNKFNTVKDFRQIHSTESYTMYQSRVRIRNHVGNHTAFTNWYRHIDNDAYHGTIPLNAKKIKLKFWSWGVSCNIEATVMYSLSDNWYPISSSPILYATKNGNRTLNISAYGQYFETDWIELTDWKPDYNLLINYRVLANSSGDPATHYKANYTYNEWMDDLWCDNINTYKSVNYLTDKSQTTPSHNGSSDSIDMLCGFSFQTEDDLIISADGINLPQENYNIQTDVRQVDSKKVSKIKVKLPDTKINSTTTFLDKIIVSKLNRSAYLNCNNNGTVFIGINKLINGIPKGKIISGYIDSNGNAILDFDNSSDLLSTIVNCGFSSGNYRYDYHYDYSKFCDYSTSVAFARSSSNNQSVSDRTYVYSNYDSIKEIISDNAISTKETKPQGNCGVGWARALPIRIPYGTKLAKIKFNASDDYHGGDLETQLHDIILDLEKNKIYYRYLFESASTSIKFQKVVSGLSYSCILYSNPEIQQNNQWSYGFQFVADKNYIYFLPSQVGHNRPKLNTRIEFYS